MANILTLGEIMLRLSTTLGERIAHSSMFAAHYGGGEANVAISLANFGHRVSFASKVPENALGDAVFIIYEAMASIVATCFVAVPD